MVRYVFFISYLAGQDLDDSAYIKTRLAVFGNTLAAMWG